MTLPMIYERIDELLDMIKKSSEDQDLFLKCEVELVYLEALREEMKKVPYLQWNSLLPPLAQ